MGEWVEPSEQMEKWYVFRLDQETAQVVRQLRTLLQGRFSTLRRHIFIESTSDASLLRLRGKLAIGPDKVAELLFVDGSKSSDQPLFDTELHAFRDKAALRALGESLKKRLLKRYPAQQFRLHYRLRLDERAIAVEAMRNRVEMLDQSHHLTYADFAAGWCHYMHVAGLSPTGKSIRDVIFDDFLPDNWQAKGIGMIFGVASHHVRLTIGADDSVWETAIEPSVKSLSRTLTWNRQHIDVYSASDERRLTDIIRPYLLARDPAFSGSILR